jgi:hypothetical protein
MTRRLNTYFFNGDRIATAQNKYLFSIWNGSSSYNIEVRRVLVLFQQVSAVASPVLSELELRLIDTTAPTSGSDLNVFSRDPAGPASLTGLVAKAGASTVADMTNGLIRRNLFTNDEQAIADLDQIYLNQEKDLFNAGPYDVGLTLYQNKGLALKHPTNDANSSVSFLVEFYKV